MKRKMYFKAAPVSLVSPLYRGKETANRCMIREAATLCRAGRDGMTRFRVDRMGPDTLGQLSLPAPLLCLPIPSSAEAKICSCPGGGAVLDPPIYPCQLSQTPVGMAI